jgi:hypothetical protein
MAAMFVVSGSALADSISVPLVQNGNYWTAGFSDSHDSAGAFTDVFTFTPASVAGLADLSFFNLSYTLPQALTFTSASVNGINVPVANLTPPASLPNFSIGGIAPTYLNGSIMLTISGVSGGNGSYAGILNVSAVPEPASYAMLMGGLAMLAYMARRRKQG